MCIGDQRVASLDMEESLGVEVGARFADFLDLAFECLCIARVRYPDREKNQSSLSANQ